MRCAPCRSPVATPSMPKARCWSSAATPRCICTASVLDKVPPHKKGSGEGWVTAEYGMLPRSTGERMRPRSRASGKQSGRTQEIQRLIGRSLRAVVDLKKLGERTLQIDCDVHPGRRRHPHRQHHRCLRRGARRHRRLAARRPAHRNAAQGFRRRRSRSASTRAQPVLDLDYLEDSDCDTDMNVVMTGQRRHRRSAGHRRRRSRFRAPRWTRCWSWPTAASAS